MIFLFTFFLFILIFFIQKFCIYPLEKNIFPSALIEQASILYLPHAARIITFYVLGPIVLIPIFLSQCFTYIVLNDSNIINSMILSFLSTLSIFLGFELFRLFKKNILFEIDKIVDWKKIILIGFLTSFFNSNLSSAYLSFNNKSTFDILLNFRFLLGDVLGLVFGMLIFTYLIKAYSIWIYNDRYKN